MGDLGTLWHPTGAACSEFAVDTILRIIRENKDDVELVAIGPLINIAVSILQYPKTMAKVSHITMKLPI